ncbi:MAG: flavin reductase [Prevotellaceae bacterium]|jgi:flavin reductase (DIM6/NTAB) family NADH-FMN oxidoreductase RutF|nr:flavin reductase [Prevotellaceae bacterium]
MKKNLVIAAALLLAACQNSPINEPVKTFTEIDSKEIPGNIIQTMSNDWMLITAGTQEKFNTMTASWGALGHLWNKPVAFCFVRPQRYTFEFTEAQDCFTLCFFDEQYREALQICGTLSGRDVNKVEKAGLTPRILESGNVAFEEARLIIECRKIYADFFDAGKFTTGEIASRIYPTNDFHKMYIGEILHVWEKR